MEALSLNEMVALEGGLNVNKCLAATLGSAVVGGLGGVGVGPVGFAIGRIAGAVYGNVTSPNC